MEEFAELQRLSLSTKGNSRRSPALPQSHRPTMWPIPAEEQLPSLPILLHQLPADVFGGHGSGRCWEEKENPNTLVWVGWAQHCPEGLDLLCGHSSCLILPFESWDVLGELLSSLDQWVQGHPKILGRGRVIYPGINTWPRAFPHGSSWGPGGQGWNLQHGAR